MSVNGQYDEQKEGYIERIGDKNIIFPRECNNFGPVFSYGKNWTSSIKPKFKHLKDEVLNNRFAPITENAWNGILKKCTKILKGLFSSKRKNRWAKLLRDNKIRMKHLVALKLYTDFDMLQREFLKSFQSPWNQSVDRLSEFVHWRNALQETFNKFSKIKSAALHQPETLFHSVNSIMCIDQYDGKYYGPCSTTTDLHVARSFAGTNGMILVIKPERDYKVLDISWISDYPDECEYLLLDHKISIETWILSCDYDQYYNFYHGIFSRLTYGNQTRKTIGSMLTKLKSLVSEVPIISNNQMNKIKRNIEFSNPHLTEKEKVDLLVWLFQFALTYKYGKKKPTKYDQSLNANIQHVMRQIHTMLIPPIIATKFMFQINEIYNEGLSVNFIRSVLNEYFINTYVPLHPLDALTVDH